MAVKPEMSMNTTVPSISRSVVPGAWSSHWTSSRGTYGRRTTEASSDPVRDGNHPQDVPRGQSTVDLERDEPVPARASRSGLRASADAIRPHIPVQTPFETLPWIVQ